MIVVNIADKSDRLEVTFDNGRVMYVSKNTNNAVRQKLEREYPELYPAENA